MISPTPTLLISLLLVGGNVADRNLSPTKPSPATTDNVAKVVSHLVGVMDTTAQAQANPQAPRVQMTTCRVLVLNQESSTYLYQEQALTQKLNQPYRQRLLKIQATADGQTVESQSFKLQQPETFIGFCNQPPSKRFIAANHIAAYVCSVLLKPTPTGFMGETPTEGCPVNVRGAVRLTNTIILCDGGMDTWDRGYDAQGNLLWGAREEAYQFRWQKPPTQGWISGQGC